MKRDSFIIMSLLGENPIIRILQKEVKPLIDTIIQQTVQKYTSNFSDFRLRQRLDLSLYLINELHEIEFVIGALDTMQSNGNGKYIPNGLLITSQVDFFGATKENVVILLDDSHHELELLYKDIQNILAHANDNHHHVYGHALYNKKLSEHKPLIPHITLGRIRTDLLKKHIGASAHQIIEDIRSCITQKVSPTIQQLLIKYGNQLIIDNFCLYDLRTKKIIKIYALSAHD